MTCGFLVAVCLSAILKLESDVMRKDALLWSLGNPSLINLIKLNRDKYMQALSKIKIVIGTLILSCSIQAGANPKYKDYPVTEYYKGSAAKLVLNNEIAKNFPTRLNEALKSKPVLAGEYVITGWGCGSSGCYDTVIINKRTGQVVPTIFEAYSAFDYEKGEDGPRVGEEIEPPRLNSRLLVTEEVVEGKNGKYSYFANYYLVDNNRLKRIKRVALKK